MGMSEDEKYIESKYAIKTFLAQLKHTIDNNCHIILQRHKSSENNRPIEYTNLYTINDLFPNEDIPNILKRVLKELNIDDYIHTVIDNKFKNRPPMRVFGKLFKDKDVYIKIRVEMLKEKIFVMSFHYALHPFVDAYYPYKSKELYGIERRNTDEDIKEI